MANDQDSNNRVDTATGTEFVGHEWDGIRELDTPMPRWWVWTFYATIVWGIVYVVLYPAWPMVEKATDGVLGWSSRSQLAAEVRAEETRRAPILAAIDSVPIEQLPLDETRMRNAISGGAAAFKVNCVQCHGAGAAGSKGYPNLNDDDWIWGGNLKEIEQTLIHGIRWDGSDETRTSFMPAFGRDGILTREQISDVTSYVLTLSGRENVSAASQRGAATYSAQCAFCHQPAGTGNRQLGAPNLTDEIWLYGDSRAQIEQQIYQSSHGVMPGWKDRLDPVTIKMLAAYVHSRGGGEDFVEALASDDIADADATDSAAAESVGDEQP